MRHFILVVFAHVVFLGALWGKLEIADKGSYYHDPRGEFASIEIEQSDKALQVLLQGRNPAKQKAMAKAVASEPGKYNPMALMALGIYYISKDEMDKGAMFLRGAAFRAKVDIHASNDRSLANTLELFHAGMQTFLRLYLSKGNTPAYQKALHKVTPMIIDWDQSVPRDYDPRWPSINSFDALNKKVVKPYSDIQEVTLEEYAAYIKDVKEQGVDIQPLLDSVKKFDLKIEVPHEENLS